MVVPWVAQVRLLHLIILGITAIIFVLYVVYLTTSQPHTNTTTLEQSLTKNERVVNSQNVSPKTSINTGKRDLTPGFLAGMIYEAGHINNNNNNTCLDQGKDLKLLIFITSAPSHESVRMAIRQTWGHFAARRDVSIVFMLGSTTNTIYQDKIENEKFLYEDILQGQFVDTYQNLTLKSISMLEWVKDNCPKVNYILKTDDDMFINIPRLLTFISNHNPETRAIYGRLAKQWRPHRNKESKYYISPQQYTPKVFPDFTTGPAYLLPGRLAKELHAASPNHTYLFQMEDVFITGLVADDLKIERIDVPEFLNKRVSLTPCSVQRHISIHDVKGTEQIDLWKKLLDGHAKCK